ncbi:AAA family ATPase [Marinobacter xiaoshiensis]|uniref:AAA family ATPase n=1 Tax=Marinobacter xiaoshiensis TaxID=3073652 RepID=A0ABU2HIA1_9GAMM|nr:AAA family ATPase [Marinobacter sp. F60267]MDS1310752.1 AAA family ATPase [Marinobacter sp. F60267]
MIEIHAKIREWLLTQPNWLQEAAKRLLTKGEMDQDDILQVSELLKTDDNPASNNQTESFFQNFALTSNSNETVRISSISEVKGIENLSPRVPLELGSGNLTVVYGHNGSGKSSYTRILKRASGNPRAVVLKPNVFTATPVEQSCKITYQVGEKSECREWSANSTPIDGIRALDIFDTDEAQHYLCKESAASYIPPVVALFESLVSVSNRIKELLLAEQNQLISSLPVLPVAYSNTNYGKLYRSLTANFNKSELMGLVSWTEPNESDLKMMTERLNVSDPSAAAAKKRTTKEQVDRLLASLEQSALAYGAEGLESLSILRNNAIRKRRIASEAAQVVSAKLEGVGAPTWQALWEAARNFSEMAYPGAVFPVTGDGARCILCHQTLEANAQERLNDFETFVKGKLEEDAKSSESTYKLALEHLPRVPTQNEVSTQCEAAGLFGQDWKECLWSFWSAALKARQQLFDYSEHHITPVADISPSLINLKAYSENLAGEAAQYDQDALNFDRQQAQKTKLDLEAKQWISAQGSAVSKEIERLQRFQIYERWKAQLNPTKISRKAGEISELAITKEYVKRFNDELTRLGAKRLKVELAKTRVKSGTALHQLQLKNAQKKEMPDAVLSEGERRIVSLAAFLADVSEKPQTAPFIFDDPISSLDQDYEWHVAQRLASLARDRQVIVFTHRLSLFGTMEDVAKKLGSNWKNANYTALCIEAYGGISGHPVDPATWNAKTKAANNILLTRLHHAKKAGEQSGREAYTQFAQGICSDFRKLLEQTVEDDLLNEVVKRHRRSITTDNRLEGLIHIEAQDCKFIDDLMTKYSCFEHSQSQEMPAFIPEEPELRTDIESLKIWREDLVKRRKTAAP